MRHRVSAFYLVVIMVFFLLLVSSVSFVYFYMLPRFDQPTIYAEVEHGGEQAGINIGYSTRRPITIYILARLPRGANYTAGPTTISVLVDSKPFLSLTCPRRTSSHQYIIICPVTINPAELPSGKHVIDIMVSTKLAGDEVHNQPSMRIEYEKTDSIIYFTSITKYPITLKYVTR